MTTSQAYQQDLSDLVQNADQLEQSLRRLRATAAQRGHLTSVLRANILAERLHVELSELQVTNAFDSFTGKVA